jgi:hypothetical protein
VIHESLSSSHRQSDPFPSESELLKVFAWARGIPVKFALVSDDASVFAINLSHRALDNPGGVKLRGKAKGGGPKTAMDQGSTADLQGGEGETAAAVVDEGGEGEDATDMDVGEQEGIRLVAVPDEAEGT